MSLAQAARHYDIQPRNDSQEDPVLEVKYEGHGENRGTTNSLLGTANRRTNEGKDMLVSFKPSELTKQRHNGGDFDMSFGGQKLLQDKKSESGSVLMKSNIETKDDTRDGQDEFLFKSTLSHKTSEE